jgi:hypothetical protein
MTEFLYGIPTNPTINDTPLAPEALQFSQWLADVFQPVGFNGTPNLSTDPMECYQYLNHRRNVIADAANQPPLVRIADKNLDIMTTIGDINGGSYLTCEVEELIADSGKAKCVLLFSHWLTNWIINENSIYEDLHLLVDPIATKPNWRTRWGGKITEINIINNADGTGTVELHAVSMREHTKRLLFAANPIFPPEVQLPRMWVLPGPTRSVLMITMFINLARLFLPGLSFITNVFNPAAWLNPLNPDALLNINPMSWPLQVAFVNPIIDQSRWTVLGATWTDWHSAMNDMLADSGVVCRAYTWLTTDEDSPHTELVDLITGLAGAGVDLLDLFGLGSIGELVANIGDDIASLARPTRNCVVFSLEDDSGQTGPTGTALDGLLNLIGVTGDDLITATLLNVDTGQTLNGEPIIDVAAPSPPIIQSLLGVAPAPPKVIWREGQFNGMLKSEVNMHKGPVLTVMTGGRSPTIVNESITFAIRYGLSQLSDVISLAVGASATFTPDNFAWQQPLTPGLDNLYQGQLDNTLLAWERFTDPVRAVWAGDLQFQEYFERGSSTAYTLAGWLTLSEANFKTRPFYGFQTEVRNGAPWVIGDDVLLGQRAGFEMGGVIYVDQITAVKHTFDRKSTTVSMSIGDDKDKHDPVARAVRAMQAVYMGVSALFGENTLFG